MGFGILLTAVASFMIFFSVQILFCYAEKAPYSFAKEATSAPPEEYHDYIVVGGGTAGCAIAATLSTAAKVLVLERGGLPYGNPNVTNMTGFVMSLTDQSPNSVSQAFVSTDGVINHRARVLGGGSAINAGFFTYASSQYVRQAGWDRRLVKESYEWVERKVAFQPRVAPWQAAVRDGLIAAGVVPYRGFTYEHLEGTKVGGTIFDENGYRHTAADLLEYSDPKKITVYLHAVVQKLLFRPSSGQRPKAYGVIFKDSAGDKHVAYLNDGVKNEIILSAGAVGSPHLLMLSGIGSAQQLMSHGIDVVLDQPSVGQGLVDNPTNGVVIPLPKPTAQSLVQVVGISDVGSYIETTSGFFSPSWAAAIAQYAKSANWTNSSVIQGGHLFEKVAKPFSTGHMEIQTLDPNDNPRVTFNYFQDTRDLRRCVQGMKIIQKVVESRAVSTSLYPRTSFQSLIELMLAIPNNLRRRNPMAAHSLEQFCNDTVMTLWHYHGSCRVAEVVDHDYKVIGVDALRIVDGSTFSSSPGTNPQATVMMLGRYVGQKILQQRSHS